MRQPPPSNIIAFARVPDAATIPQRPLNRLRQDFLREFDVWLQTSADPSAALLELENTVSAVRGLVGLTFCDLADHPLVAGSPAAKGDAQ